MAETGLPLGAVYSGATVESLEEARRIAESRPDGYIPSAFNPATCSQKGYCKVARSRVPMGGNKEPSPDAVSKGAKTPYSDANDKDRRGFNLYYEVHGTGAEHVVFLMGLNNSCFGWLNQVEHLAKDPRYSCLVLDNRGYGNSDIPAGSYRTSEMAQDVLDLLDYLQWTGTRSVHVVGISMGGMITLELAKAAPERIASITLISTTSGRGNGEKSLQVSLPPWKGVSTITRLVAGRSLGFDSDEYRVNAVSELLFPPAFLAQKSTADAKGRTNGEVMQDMFAFRYTFTRRQTLFGALSQVWAVITHRVSAGQLKQINEAIPTIAIITGGQDNLVNPGNSSHLKRHLPRATLHEIKEGGHAMTIQLPDVINNLLDKTFDESRDELSKGHW